MQQEGNVYRSINWVYRYYTSFDHSVNLDDKIPYYFKQIRRRGFKEEKRKERKLIYTTYKYFKTLKTEEKKAVTLVAKGNRLTIRAALGTRFFVSKIRYNVRRQNVLKKATFVAKHYVRLIVGFDFDEKIINEFRIKNKTVNMTIWDFLPPFFRLKERGLNFDQFRFFCKGAPSQYKNLIEPSRSRAEYNV